MSYHVQTLQQPRKGCYLLANAYLGDPNFDRSVVLLTAHNEDGSLGFVMNQPTDISLNALLPEFPEFPAPVFNGGPVEKDHLYYVHSREDLIPDSQKIRDGLYWGGEFDALKEQVLTGALHPQDIHFYLGYSGWSVGQLHEEIKEKSWSIMDPRRIGLTDMRSADLWKGLMRDTGTEQSYWHLAPEDPQLN